MWSRFNPYILKGYRINYDTCAHASKTLFMLHNETTNVMSHLCGAVIYVYLLFYLILNL